MAGPGAEPAPVRVDAFVASTSRHPRRIHPMEFDRLTMSTVGLRHRSVALEPRTPDVGGGQQLLTTPRGQLLTTARLGGIAKCAISRTSTHSTAH